MKILFLTNHLRGDDGLSKVSLDFAEELQNLGHNILCLTHEKSNQTKIKEVLILSNLLKYLVNPLLAFLTATRIRKIVKDFSPDVIHFMEGSYASILPFLKTEEAKTFITVHGTYSVIPILFKSFPKRLISGYLSKKYYQKVNGIIPVSNYTKNHLLRYYPDLKPKIQVVTNGINLGRNKLIDLDKKPKNETKQILFVGAIKGRKGVLEAVEACKYYRDNFSNNFIYNIVGEYNQKSKYYRMVLRKIKKYGMADKILFRGRLIGKDLQNYYLNADLFLMPSLNINNNFEGFGLVFLEANAKGVPCIGSKNSGCQEAIVDGKTGYVIDPFNPKEVAQKMDLILNRNTIEPKNCLNWAKQNDVKIKTKELINFYQKLL